MKLLLPPHIVSDLTHALIRGRKREVGGIMMGEHVGPDTFRLTRITVQLEGGTFATFRRLVEHFVGPLQAFFKSTNHNYTRHNYLGEWHSHHSFALTPSGTDNDTMTEIVTDPSVGARFAVLLLVRLAVADKLEYAATVYSPMSSSPATVFVESAVSDPTSAS